jgi:hypothetical protein
MNVCIEFVSWLVVALQLKEQNCMQTFCRFSPLIAGVGFKPLNMIIHQWYNTSLCVTKIS